MLDKKNLIDLAKVTAKAEPSSKVAYSFGENSFSYSDLNETLRAELREIAGTYALYRENKNTIFELIEQTIDDILPRKVMEQYAQFAEVKTFARDAEPLFEIKKVGKARARMAITEGARGGVYKARRLDNKNVSIDVKVETVGAFVTLEEILLGKVSLAELMANIRDGFVEKIYINTVKALRTAKTLAPAANVKSGNGFATADIDGLVRIAGAYGTPVIMGFRSIIAKITNDTNWNLQDKDDIRNKGFVTVYKGTPVVELPNYLVDETNSEFVFQEGDLFILPTESKPVKVAMKGDLHIEEFKQPSGSMEQSAHRLIGVGLVLANNICVYTDKDVSGGNY
jgi:hypothetical protein